MHIEQQRDPAHQPRCDVIGTGVIACPGGSYSLISLSTFERCWARIGTGKYPDAQCRTAVDPDDELGLCEEHVTLYRNEDNIK